MVVDLQHDNQKVIISTQHVHLDHDNCLEIVAVRGRSRDVQKLADQIRAVKGVRHAAFNVAGLGRESR